MGGRKYPGEKFEVESESKCKDFQPLCWWFRKVMQRCRLRDRISLCAAPSVSMLSIVSGFLWEPIKDFCIMVHTEILRFWTLTRPSLWGRFLFGSVHMQFHRGVYVKW